jgi:hypothetical protein
MKPESELLMHDTEFDSGTCKLWIIRLVAVAAIDGFMDTSNWLRYGQTVVLHTSKHAQKQTDVTEQEIGNKESKATQCRLDVITRLINGYFHP